MSRAERRCAVTLGKRLLAGVGESLDDAPTRIDRSARVMHIRRALTFAEERLLPKDWAELEAIDVAGTGGFLDALARARP